MTWVPIDVCMYSTEKYYQLPISTFRHIMCMVIGVASQYQVISCWLYNSTTKLLSLCFWFMNICGVFLENVDFIKTCGNKLIGSSWCHVTTFSFHAVCILMTIHGNIDDELPTGEWSFFHFKLFLFGHII